MASERSKDKKFLTQEQKIKLIDFMRSAAERWAKDRPKIGAAMAECSKAVGGTVPHSAFKAMRKALKISWRPLSATEEDEDGWTARGAIKSLEYAVRVVFEHLGLPPTDGMANLRYRIEKSVGRAGTPPAE